MSNRVGRWNLAYAYVFGMSRSEASSAADELRNWFASVRPTADVALSEADEAQTRGHITRDEYLELLDAWPDVPRC